jgi:SanA protein
MALLLLKVFLGFIGLLMLSVFLARAVIVAASAPYILAEADQPTAQVALVFGAGLRRDGSPTAILRDRVQAAVQLYREGKVDKLLLSGDNSYIYYNEPGAMKEYAIGLGVPEEDIVLDYAGRRTYDSCYRAGVIFGITKAILVTQPFHLPRAVYTCRQMGLDATGFAAENIYFRKVSRLYWNIREVPAMLVAFFDVNITHPIPILGDKEPIFPSP